MLGAEAAEHGVRDFAQAQAQETRRFPPFFHAFLSAGVALPPSVFEAWFVSAAHGDAEIGAVAAAAPAAEKPAEAKPTAAAQPAEMPSLPEAADAGPQDA